jgi:hypothetical protein
MQINTKYNYTPIFKSRNKDIKKADDIQRKSRQTFPVMSPTYVDKFYKSTKTNADAKNIYRNLDRKLGIMRNLTTNSSLGLHSPFEKKIPFTRVLSGIQFSKVGNCHECSIATLAALAANGYYDSQRENLVLEIDFIDKKTGEDCYINELLDHSFVVTTLDKKNKKEKDKIVVDSWLGFADSVSGAKERYKHLYSDKKINNIIEIKKDMFKQHKLKKDGVLIDFNDYDIRYNMQFYPVDNLKRDVIKELGMYSRIMFENLVLPKSH